LYKEKEILGYLKLSGCVSKGFLGYAALNKSKCVIISDRSPEFL